MGTLVGALVGWLAGWIPSWLTGWPGRLAGLGAGWAAGWLTVLVGWLGAFHEILAKPERYHGLKHCWIVIFFVLNFPSAEKSVRTIAGPVPSFVVNSRRLLE